MSYKVCSTHLDVIGSAVLRPVAAAPGERRHVASRLAQVRPNINNFALERRHLVTLRYVEFAATVPGPHDFIVLRFYHYRHLMVSVVRLQPATASCF